MTGCEVVNLLIDNAVEREYMTECANLLSRMVKGNLKIVLKHHFQKLPRADRKRTILIDISDESHSVPRDITRPDVFIISAVGKELYKTFSNIFSPCFPFELEQNCF